MTLPHGRRALVSCVISGIFLCAIGLLISVNGLLYPQFWHVSALLDGHLHEKTTPRATGDYLLGVGKADITGPVVELNLMGYADPSQIGTGLRQRIYCRAFIIADPTDPSSRILYLVLDTQSGDTAVRYGILEGLKTLGTDYALYTKDNVAVTGTHSHSGPAAWLNYLLPQITSKGFDKQSYQAIVKGSLVAIQRAHESITPGYLSFGNSTLLDANINRSPYAYLANPQAEQEKYEHDVDKTFELVLFRRASDNLPLGMLSWFPVHGTSLYENNTLVAGDNKGVAAYLMEKDMQALNPSFVAGFSQANVGDTSPNTLGPVCQDTGLPCAFEDSTCGGKTELCRGRGPFFAAIDSGTKSCFEIGRLQYEAARGLITSNSLQRLTPGTVSSFHFYQDMDGFAFTSPFNQSELLSTCSAALGYSFAGGTTDGPGAFDFTQGINDTDPDAPALDNPLWQLARAFLHQPSSEQVKCQAPKPILLDVGSVDEPYAWTPNIVDIQLLRVGQLVFIIAAGEATTMSGRRWKEAVASASRSLDGLEDPIVVLGGPANTYAHYIATAEEFSVQRYEGASTLYGRNTLAAYVNLTVSHIAYLGNKDQVGSLPPLDPGPQPPINVNSSLSLITGVVLDLPTLFHQFGDCLESPDSSTTHRAGELVGSKFVGANPRNNLRLEGTYAAVEKYNPASGVWTQVLDDSDWYLTFQWTRTSTLLATSEVTIEWEIQPGTETGLYRMHYYGDWKAIDGSITAFEGLSNSFNVDSGNA
ncbi:hypothetical protein DV738_g3564, partial [Chaetothyriales sp. CBS 135597]